MKIKIALFFISSLHLTSAFCQNKSNEGELIELNQITDAWHYFELKDTANVKIIEHYPAIALCGIVTFYSISIVEDEDGEVFRVLDLCNMKESYRSGETFKIIPMAVNYNAGVLPYSTSIMTGKIQTLSKLDSSTRRTTWAFIPRD